MPAVSRRWGSMSCRAMVVPYSSGKLRVSVRRFLVKTTLPAPIKAIFKAVSFLCKSNLHFPSPRLLHHGHPGRRDVDLMQPGLERDAVRMHNASSAIPHLYPACACVVREIEHDALLERAVYDKERCRNLPPERNDRVPVGCCDQLRLRAGEHDGVNHLRV